jgi:hypothetical protein
VTITVTLDDTQLVWIAAAKGVKISELDDVDLQDAAVNWFYAPHKAARVLQRIKSIVDEAFPY